MINIGNKMKESNDIKTNRSENKEEELRLQYECEQAFLRKHFAAPSIDDEWKRFMIQSHKKEKASSPKIIYRNWIITAISAAAVFVGILLFSTLNDTEETINKPMLVLTVETNEPSTVVKEVENKHMNETRPLFSAQDKKHSQQESSPLVANEASPMVQYNKVTIPKGKTYQVILSDGTEVWLNSGSRLSYPSDFMADSRTVHLEGEAFFKVASNPQKPFVVMADKVATYVLGTEFNVKAYQGSETHVTLVKGSVKVEIPEQNKEVLLHPGEDLAYDINGSYSIKQVDTERYVQWMAGYFYFDNVCLRDILYELGVWYNLTIEMEEDPALMNMRLHFVAERFDEPEKVIDALNMYHYLSVTKSEHSLIVRRKLEKKN